MPPPKSIVHLDADAFFASVEQAADPRLRGKPIAVGGEKRGIIASASYEARKFGVHTPMPTVRARKLCPRLIVLPGNYDRYEHFSTWMFSYAYDFTPDVEQTSIDEGYFDLSAARKAPAEIALIIRKAIGQSLKISVSEGIAANKLVSQIASKLHKPAAFAEVPPGGEIAFLHPLPNQWLPGIGPKTAVRLNAAGLARIGQIAGTPLDMLHLLMGNAARALRDYANGIDNRPIIPAREPQKSFSQQETFARDLTDEEYIEATLRRMADNLFATVREEARSIRTLTVKVRYNDMGEDQAGESLLEPTDLETDIYSRLHTMLRAAWKRRVSLRLVSLKLSNVYDGRFRGELALDAPAERQDARERLALAIDGLRQARGHSVILRGHDFRLREEPDCGLRIADPPSLRSGAASCGLAGAVSEAGVSEPVSSEFRLADSLIRSFTTAVSDCGLQQQAPRLPQLRAGSPSSIRNPQSAIRNDYVPLRVHSHYSFLDSTLSPSAIVKLAKQHGMSAVALTDTGNLHGAVEFTLAAKQAGIKPVLGVEISLDQKPLLLYVQSAPGYANLNRLLSRHAAAMADRGDEGSAGTIQRRSQSAATVEATADGDRASVANQQRGPFNRRELHGLTDGLIAVSADARLAELFPGRFYSLAGAQTTPAQFKPAACPAIRCATPADRWKFDIVQSIRTLTLLREEHPEKRRGRIHFRAPAEMAAACKEHPEWLTHTAEIAERCQFDLPFGKPQFPAFLPPDGSPPGDFLRRLVLRGLQKRYGPRAAQFQPQVMEELGIIAEVGYEEYFLITWDFLQDCRKRGIEWITRGSAADSLVCYCLGISGVCPIRFDLYFRRFLNKERMAMHKLPDIDIDFAHDLKDDVVKLIFEKYGRDHCAVVGGFSTFQAKSAFAEVAKVLGVAEREVRKFTDHFPWSFGGGWVPAEHTPSGGAGLIEILRASPENRDLPLDEEPYRTALHMAEFLDGVPRHPKMHPCGLVLSRQLMHELTPTFISNKGCPTTHFDMDAVEAVGLVKMDILAQGGLAAMRDVKQTLAARGIHIDLESLEPWKDPAVWEMIAGGGARAVHHIESPAMVSLCRQCNVREIDGLVAIVSVIRPGAANEGKKLAFTRRYQGLEPVAYPHPSLESCLRGTFGLVVYEEHILQISEAFAGLNPGRADVLRRALNKQNRPMIETIRGEFIQSALARGHSPEKIAEVWGLVTGFAGYAFCKAHSTAYGVEAYQAAWLKKYYPVEFMAAVLSNGKGFYHPIVYVLECHRLGATLLPPSVNRPGRLFTPEGRTIRVPIRSIKGLSERTNEQILAERDRAPFETLQDFYRRVAPSMEEMEAMLRVGAFDEFGKPRTAQFWECQLLQRAFKTAPDGRQGLLLPEVPLQEPTRRDRLESAIPPIPPIPPIPSIPLQEPTRREHLESENELLGFPASGHPLELHDHIAWETYCPVSRLGEHVGREVVTCGLIVEQRTHHQITGEPMKFLTLADWTGMVETELFAQTYKSYGLATVRYPVLEITARVEPYDNARGFSLRVLRAGKPRTRDSQFDT